MAEKELSDLPEATSAGSLDIFHVKDSLNVDKKITLDNLSKTLSYATQPELTTATMAANPNYTLESVGKTVVQTKEFSTGNGGGGVYDIISGTGTANGYNIIAHGTNAISFVLREVQGFNLIKQYGGVSGSDITTIATDIKSTYKSLYVPNGTWKGKDIPLNSFDKIFFESRSAVFEGVISTDDVFVSSGAVTGVTVTGGRFNNCNNAFYHTGNSALASSVFEDTLYTNLSAGFDLSSAVGVTWRSNEFGVGSGTDNIAYGVRFRKTGTGQTNINNFYGNRYAEYSVAGVSYDDSAVVADINFHYGDWFEDSTHNGLFVGGNCNNLKLFGGYFETTGSASESDIEINVTTGTSTGIALYGVGFRTSVAAQTSRIKTTGNCAVHAYDCDSTLDTGQVFAEINSSGGPFLNKLHNNRLNGTGAGTYKSRLFSISGTQQVDWSTYVGSAQVTDDDFNKQVATGSISYPWITFTNADATPSVAGGVNFKTAGTTTITTFDDGEDGQVVRVKAGNTITVIGVAMVLNDVAEFINDGGTWRPINK